MRLKYEFEYMELDDQIVGVPVGEGAQSFRGVIKLNDSATEIIKLLQSGFDEDSIVDVMKTQYYASEKDLKYAVHEFITELEGKGLLMR